MKDLQGSLIFAMCLLAFTAVVFFFKYGQERTQSKMLEAETKLVQIQARTIEQKAAEAERIANESIKKNLEKVKVARAMLEKSKQTNALTQKEIVEKLNAQLEREAEARIAAENASKELLKQRDALNKAVFQTKSDLARLENLKNDTSASEKITNMRKLLRDREMEIERLKKRQLELEELNEQARAAQLMTEREIERRGGLVLLPHHKRILSPR